MIQANKIMASKLRPLHTAAEARMSEDEQTELLEAIVQRRDRKAFAILVEQFEGPAFRLAMHLTNQRELAEEAVQEAMLAVWFGVESFRPGSDLRKWILGIVAYRALRAARKSKTGSKDMEWERERRAARPKERPPGEKAEHQEILEKLRGMLSGLPDLERQLVALYYGAGLTQQQIGDELKMPRRTVAFKLQETLKDLRNSLAGAGLAAAPALTGNLLSDCLMSGPTESTGILESTLLRCDQPSVPRWHQRSVRTSRAARSTRAAAVGGSKAAVAVVAAMLLALLAAAWFAPSKDATPASAQSTPVEATVLPQAPALAQPKTWAFNFNGPIDEGFDFLKGDVYLSRMRTNPRKVLVLDNVNDSSSAVLLPDTGPRLPVRVRAKIWIYKHGRMHIGMGWTDGQHTVDAQHWPTKNRDVRTGEMLEFTGYFIGPYVIRMSKDTVGGLSKELADLSKRRLYIVGRNIAVENIEIEELREEDIPEEFRDMEAFVASYGKPAATVPGAQWRAEDPRPLAEYLKENTKRPTP